MMYIVLSPQINGQTIVQYIHQRSAACGNILITRERDLLYTNIPCSFTWIFTSLWLFLPCSKPSSRNHLLFAQHQHQHRHEQTASSAEAVVKAAIEVTGRYALVTAIASHIYPIPTNVYISSLVLYPWSHAKCRWATFFNFWATSGSGSAQHLLTLDCSYESCIVRF